MEKEQIEKRTKIASKKLRGCVRLLESGCKGNMSLEEIEEMESRVLLEEEKKNLKKIKEYYQEGRYDQALRLLIYPQEK